MHFTIATNLFRLTDKENQLIEKLVKKVVTLVPFNEPDYPTLDIVMSKQSKKGRAQFAKKIITVRSSYGLKGQETVDNPIYYDGTLDLILPKRRIIAKMLGRTPSEALRDGFEELLKELDSYKGLHFPNDSKFDTYKKSSV